VAVLSFAVLAACTPKDVGYVEIKTVPVATPTTMLYLDSLKFEPPKNGSAVLRQQVGTAKLAAQAGGGQMAVLCDIVVSHHYRYDLAAGASAALPMPQYRRIGTVGGALLHRPSPATISKVARCGHQHATNRYQFQCNWLHKSSVTGSSIQSRRLVRAQGLGPDGMGRNVRTWGRLLRCLSSPLLRLFWHATRG
jgi:hypothetical protein